jgi:hypothetical protein
LNSPVLKWPDRESVDKAARIWAAREVKHHPELIRLGYFGSYARGDWGVGSDLDLIAIVKRSSEPFERRSRTWDLHTLPVPAELLIYTLREWQHLRDEAGRFVRMIDREAVWIFGAE